MPLTATINLFQTTPCSERCPWRFLPIQQKHRSSQTQPTIRTSLSNKNRCNATHMFISNPVYDRKQYTYICPTKIQSTTKISKQQFAMQLLKKERTLTLCLVPWNFCPGFPKPTKSHGLGPSTKGPSAKDVEIHLREA